MENRHLYRGKRLDNGEFIRGNLVHGIFFKGETKENIPYIMTGDFIDYDCFGDFSDDYGYYEVNPATVGQATGLLAAKSYRGESEVDRLIWESDIIKITIPPRQISSEITVAYGDVFYEGGGFRVLRNEHPGSGQRLDSFSHECVIEILGTIHDKEVQP